MTSLSLIEIDLLQNLDFRVCCLIRYIVQIEVGKFIFYCSHMLGRSKAFTFEHQTRTWDGAIYNYIYIYIFLVWLSLI